MRLNDVPLTQLAAAEQEGALQKPAATAGVEGIDLTDPEIRSLPVLALALACALVQNARKSSQV